MIKDGLLTFTGTSNGASGGITSASYTDSPTTGTQIASNILDLGVTSGVPTSANGGGARDLAVSNRALFLSAICTTAFAGGTSLQLELDGAADNGSGAPSSTWTVMWQSQAILEANLSGPICNVDLMRVVPAQALPRFLRMRFITVGTHNAGAINCAIDLDEDLQTLGVTGLYSGYPAGISVAN